MFFKKNMKRMPKCILYWIVRNKAKKDAIKVHKALKKVKPYSEVAFIEPEIVATKHESDESNIVYTFSTDEDPNKSWESRKKSRTTVPNILFKANNYPKEWREELKEVYMETFENDLGFDVKWDFDIIIKISMFNIKL